jgi:O-antigen/teichoic acid export membrane protein
MWFISSVIADLKHLAAVPKASWLGGLKFALLLAMIGILSVAAFLLIQWVLFPILNWVAMLIATLSMMFTYAYLASVLIRHEDQKE